MTKEEMVDAPIGTPVGPPPDDPAVELFVSGRVCLLGEHSDWAGGFRSVNPEVGKGRCLVVGTLEGLHACASKGDAPTLRMTSTDNAGGRRSIELPLDDPAALLKTAAEGGFWSHVAGTVHALVGDSSSRHAAAVAAAGHGLVIDNHRTTLPVKKGLSSSAAVCVLVARAFSSVYGLSCSSREEMEIAYRGRLVLLTFDGDELEVEPVSRVGSDVHLVVADLNATKDTVTILRDLQMGYPRASTAIHEGVHRLLGDINARLVAAAVDAIAAGDAARLGQVYVEAQAEFDAHAAPACPAQLTAPKLHKVLQHPSLVAHVHGGKGVGSQGDGTVQFLCRGAEGAKATADVLAKDFGLTTMHVVIPASIHEQ